MSQTDPSTGTGSGGEGGSETAIRRTRGDERDGEEGGETMTGRAPATGQSFGTRAHDKDNDRREPHTRLAHVQGPSRERKPRFFLWD